MLADMTQCGSEKWKVKGTDAVPVLFGAGAMGRGGDCYPRDARMSSEM